MGIAYAQQNAVIRHNNNLVTLKKGDNFDTSDSLVAAFPYLFQAEPVQVRTTDTETAKPTTRRRKPARGGEK